MRGPAGKADGRYAGKRVMNFERFETPPLSKKSFGCSQQICRRTSCCEPVLVRGVGAVAAVELSGLLREGSRVEIDRGKGWAELRLLQLVDAERGEPINEWFYVFACNRYYFEMKVPTDFPGQGSAFLIQDELDIGTLTEFARRKVRELDFKDWGDFYGEMVKEFVHQEFEFRGLIKEPQSLHRIDCRRGWAQWRALNLYDRLRNRGVAEWFYVVACNRHYLERISSSYYGKEGAFLVQEEFNENDLIRFAQDKMSKLTFSSFDDFFKKMSLEFIWEDEDRKWW